MHIDDLQISWNWNVQQLRLQQPPTTDRDQTQWTMKKTYTCCAAVEWDGSHVRCPGTRVLLVFLLCRLPLELLQTWYDRQVQPTVRLNRKAATVHAIAVRHLAGSCLSDAGKGWWPPGLDQVLPETHSHSRISQWGKQQAPCLKPPLNLRTETRSSKWTLLGQVLSKYGFGP